MKFSLLGFLLLIELNYTLLAQSIDTFKIRIDNGVECHELKKYVQNHNGEERSLYLNIRRYPRADSPVIIMSHAVVLNNLAMSTLGQYFWKAGYDVWMPNMRAHGNGEELSRMEPYQAGDYHFDRIVSEDWPLVADYVFETTGKQLNILGYSMGGMTWEQYLSGVYFDGTHMNQSDDLALKRAEKVASFIALTVPADLSSINPTIKNLLNPLLPWFRRYRITLPFTTSSSSLSKLRLMSITEWVRRFVLSLLTPILPIILPGGIIEAQNGGPGEFDRLVKQQLSSPHSDFVGDLLSWFEGDYESLDAKVNYGLNKKVMVPTLMICASEDQLAPAEYCLQQSALYPEEAKARKILVRGFSHIDISFAKALPMIGESMLKFCENPESLCKVNELLVMDANRNPKRS
ncbi:MAG: alpha/beta hydrolase [Oligoflexales bacterium]